jgi:hypothetical protein
MFGQLKLAIFEYLKDWERESLAPRGKEIKKTITPHYHFFISLFISSSWNESINKKTFDNQLVKDEKFPFLCFLGGFVAVFVATV